MHQRRKERKSRVFRRTIRACFVLVVGLLLRQAARTHRKTIVPSQDDELGIVKRHISNAAYSCPTSKDVLSLLGYGQLLDVVWDDPTCSKCKVRFCAMYSHIPCCVVDVETSLHRAYDVVCKRMIENGLEVRLRQGEHPRDLIKYCLDFISLKLDTPECEGKREIVPRVIHSVGRTNTPAVNIQLSAQLANFTLHHLGDEAAYAFILENCSEEVAKAYKCIKPAAFRADLYRFCALYAKGGVYLDSDMVLLVPLIEAVSMCSRFTLGYDQAQGEHLSIENVGLQMKILASAPKHPISACMMSEIVNHVKSRYDASADPLSFSGPNLLRKCHDKFQGGAIKTYIDTRGADWPYSGMRRGTRVLAYERTDERRHFGEIRVAPPESGIDYDKAARKGAIYKRSCEL